MIRELRIKNLALIEDLVLDFQDGFSVFTGETGAGKSILIGAIGLLLGERASSEMIRSGTEEAEISGVMEIKKFRPPLNEFLKESGIETEDGILIIRRKISRSDKNRIHINQIPVPLSSLKKLGDMLIDLHGQHQHQSLLDENTHIRLINVLPETKPSLELYSGIYRTYTQAQEKLESARRTARELAEKKDMLEYQYNELKSLDMRIGEVEELEAELTLLTSSADRMACATDILAIMNPPEFDSFQKNLSLIRRKLEIFCKYDPSVGPWILDLDGVLSVCTELDMFCTSYLEKTGTDLSQSRIEEINSRLAKIQRLKKKYNCSLEELIAKKQRLEQSLSSLETSDSQIELLQKELEKTKQVCIDGAQTLSENRNRASERFDKEITRRMKELGFKGGQWKTDFQKMDEPGPQGLETLRFLVQTNPGEPLLALARSASGGEISRLMLAVKSILAEHDEIPVLIFDEIDTGIGGVLAGEVSKALYCLSSTHQVLCISHLHQIASAADHHYRVSKAESAGRTITVVEPLNESQRINEIARMLGGESDISRKHAQELLRENRPVQKKSE